MLGMLAYHSRGEDAAPVRLLCGVRFRCVYVRRGESPLRRLEAAFAADALHRAGVTYALLPSGYPYAAAFERRGVVSPPLAPFYRASAAAVVRCRMKQLRIEPRAACVTLVGSCVSPELRLLALSLCGEVRHLALDVPDGAPALSRELLVRRGVAARLGTQPDADLAVAFDGERAPRGALVLDETLEVSYESELPNELLAALWTAGALDAGALRVRAVTPCGSLCKSAKE